MALTLTQTAKLTKKAFLFGLILFFLALISFISFQIYYYQYYLPHKPAPVVKPQIGFGVLPKLQFISSSTTSSNFSYSLATSTGGLPNNFPKVVKVYFIPQLGTTLLAPDKSKSLAQSLSFSEGPEILNQTQYRFSDANAGAMTINLDSGNFTFFRDSDFIASASAKFANSTLPDEKKIIDDFRSFLSSKKLLTDDLRVGRAKVIYDSSSPGESQTALVTIWPDNFDNLEIATPNYTLGLIKATVTKSGDELTKYKNLDFTYWNPDQNNASTYPVKTPTEAFNDLQTGLGAVIIEPSSPQVSITSVKMAYYESNSYLKYLIPIYIFEGQGFVGYVNAIPSNYLN